jgi:hypothetical protein
LEAGAADADAAAADEEAAAAAAALPSGLPAEKPGVFADASPESQFNDMSTWSVGDPPLFSGAGSVLETWLTTMQSSLAFRSPTVVEMTGVIPAPLMAAVASVYF